MTDKDRQHAARLGAYFQTILSSIHVSSHTEERKESGCGLQSSLS